MDYVTLGRTGLHVSVMGLGGGGHSRLGQQTGGSEEQSVAIVRRALNLGINFFDTAEAYGTESLIGSALGEKTRDEVTLSTKKSMTLEDRLITPEELVQGLEASLSRLGTDRVEIYHLHGVRADHYNYARETLVPTLFKLREQGKIRFLGITEAFAPDPTHQMMARAVLDDCWDVVMVGFNILNQSARDRIFPHTQQRGIGVLDMFAVRRAFSQPDKLRQTVAELLQQGVISSTTAIETQLDPEEPLAFLLSDGSAQSLPDAAYRFCRAEPGIDVVLSGTGNLSHLEENVRSLLRPPLPEEHRARLIRMFAGIDSVSGQ
jgi:aryl-alcohol dehydrogenase-like predicted oxidoreductase